MSLQTLSSAGVFRFGVTRQARTVAFPLGLGEQGVHEVCEAGFGDMAALAGFALAAGHHRTGGVVWVSTGPLLNNHGRLLEAGLKGISRKESRILHVEARKPVDALWATEEAVRSRAAGLVIAELTGMDFTASRRLTLASSRSGVPAILLMPYTREGATASAARWRVSPRPSAPNRYDRRALGNLRWRAMLERSRQAPHMAGQGFDLEVDYETLSLTVVSGLATDAPPPRTVRAETEVTQVRRTG